MTNQTPVSVDYTSRDYYSIRNDLIARVQNNVNVPGTGVNWLGTDPTDFGVALLEAFAYMGDIVNYYIDRIANENYIGTATQRQSIIDLAKTYGYTPSGYQAANVELTFYNASGSDVIVPAGTQASGQAIFNDIVEEVIFTTTADVTVPANSSLATSATIQGERVSTRSGNDPLYGELVGYSDGTPNQVFVLSENQVVEDSVEVYVEVGNGTDYNLWKKVTRITDSGPADAVYTLDTDADNFVYVTFGDGVSGVIPVQTAAIKVNYLVGGGQVGNIAVNLVNNIRYAQPGVDLSAITVSNTSVGIGGSDPESNDSIRKNAPKALSALTRAVTLADYASLALTVPNVGKANAIAETKNSVTVYLAPLQSSALTDLFPGYTGDPATGGVLTSDWSALVTSVQTYLADKTQIGVTTTIAPPTYVDAHLLLRFTTLPQYTAAQVKSSIMLDLVNGFSYDSAVFGGNITPESIEARVRQVEGVYNASVIALYRAGQTGRNVLIGGPGEIFVFQEANLDVNVNSSDSTLASLTSSAGTLSPAFDSSLLNYNLALPNGTTSTNITPTNATATITVNGAPTNSGSAATVTTSVGTTTIVVNVLAQDGVTNQAYRITATRAS
jgi:hypothetical protein